MLDNITAQEICAEHNTPAASAPRRLTPHDLQQLGARARQRREELRLTRNFLAKGIGVPPSTLFNFEMCMKYEPQAIETEWERLLHVPPGWLRNAEMVAPAVGDYPSEMASTDTVAEEIRKIVCWYSRRPCIGRTVVESELDADEQEMAQAVITHYGVYGEERAHLPSVTKTQKALSQKSRQLLARFTKRITTAVMAPAMRRLQAALPSFIPGTLDSVNVALAPLLGDQLTLEGANRFALEIYGVKLCKITPRHELNASTRERMVLSYLQGPSARLVAAVRTTALDMVRFVGAAHIQFVTAMVGEEMGTPLSAAVVLECCRTQSAFEWLSEGDGWFWFGPDTANRIAKVAMKIFAVASVPVQAEEVQAGIGRSGINRYEGYRTQPFMIEPPAYVIAELVSRLPNVYFSLYRDMSFKGQIPRSDFLTDTEQMIQDVIVAHGGVACRKTLVHELVDSGRVLLQTMERALDMSPIFKHIEPRVWGLRGNRIHPRALEGAINTELQCSVRPEMENITENQKIPPLRHKNRSKSA